MGRVSLRAGTLALFTVGAALIIGHSVFKVVLAGSPQSGSLEQFEHLIFGPSASDTMIPSILATQGPILDGIGADDAAGRLAASGGHPRASFQDRFASAFAGYGQEDEPTRPRRPAFPVSTMPSVTRPEVPPNSAVVEAAPGAPRQGRTASKKSARFAALLDELGSVPEADARTAIYDIAAHAVYLPNGDTLEAHSGLGSKLDDPQFASVKNRGPTPPNVYDLVLRRERFHGVRAIRLVPVGEGKMFGRDGLLAHSYMLGPKGQSNGCVSFRDYPAFLNAFLRGDVERLVVVDHLAAAPTARSGSAWSPESLWNSIKARAGRAFESSGKVDPGA